MLRNYLSTPILLTALLLGGCWTIPFPSGDTPDKYTKSKKTIKSLIGSTSDEVEIELGEPTWVIMGGSKIYYVYEWWSDEADIIMVGYLPMPWIFTEENTEAHCMLLNFGSEWRLLDHKVGTQSGTFHSYSPVNCLEVFGFASKMHDGAGGLWTMRENYSWISLDEIKILVEEKLDDIKTGKHENNEDSRYELFRVDKYSSLSQDEMKVLSDVAVLDYGDSEIAQERIEKEHERQKHKAILSRDLEIKAQAGDAEAQYHLFLLQDRKPFKWLCRSADQGHVDARLELAYIYRSGAYGYPQDYLQSYIWYRLSAAGEQQKEVEEILAKLKNPSYWNPIACDSGRSCFIARQLFDLQGIITPAGLEEADRIIEAWRPGQCEMNLEGVNQGIVE